MQTWADPSVQYVVVDWELNAAPRSVAVADGLLHVGDAVPSPQTFKNAPRASSSPSAQDATCSSVDMRHPLAVGQQLRDLHDDTVTLRVLETEAVEDVVEVAGLVGRDSGALDDVLAIAGHRV